MGTSAVGSIVLVPFPFSDLTASKLRPAAILADASRDDWICAQITSNPYSDPVAIKLLENDFHTGSLARVSYLRPSKLFTANTILFHRTVATLGEVTLINVLQVVAAQFQR